MPRLEEGDFSAAAIKEKLRPFHDRILAQAALQRLCEAVEAAVREGLDVEGSDRVSISRERFNDLHDAAMRAQLELQR
jgi:hypothetical protein